MAEIKKNKTAKFKLNHAESLRFPDAKSRYGEDSPQRGSDFSGRNNHLKQRAIDLMIRTGNTQSPKAAEKSPSERRKSVLKRSTTCIVKKDDTDIKEQTLISAIPTQDQFDPYPFVRDDVSEALVLELKQTFDLFDSDRSGSIDPKELKTLMLSLGFDAKNETIYQMISDLDDNGSQTMEFEEFYDMMCNQIDIKETLSNEDAINEVFQLFTRQDPNSGGTITLESLKKLARELGDPISNKDLEGMITMISPGQSCVSENAFQKFLTKKKSSPRLGRCRSSIMPVNVSAEGSTDTLASFRTDAEEFRKKLGTTIIDPGTKKSKEPPPFLSIPLDPT